MCVCVVWVGSEDNVGCVSQDTSTLVHSPPCLKQGLSMSLELTDSILRAGQRALGMVLSLPLPLPPSPALGLWGHLPLLVFKPRSSRLCGKALPTEPLS